jgi:hypothetical protein
MEQEYWLSRKRASMVLAHQAEAAEARLIHYELAGRYSIKASRAERPHLEVIDSPPMAAYGCQGGLIIDSPPVVAYARRDPPACH